MTLELSPNEIKAIGKMWEPSLFTQDEIEELVSKVSPEVRLRGLKPEDRLIGLKPEERLAGINPSDVINYLPLEDRLRGLPTEEIEAYLKQRK